MYGGPSWIPCMDINIMWYSLTTLQSMYDFIYLKRNLSLGHIYLVQSFSWFFFNSSIIQLYTNNGWEYIALQDFLAQNGISHLTTPPHTLEHNGNLELRHRNIVEIGLTLLYHAFMPLSFWQDAFATTTYLINKMPKTNLGFTSFYKKFFGTPPNLEKLRIFGCLFHS